MTRKKPADVAAAEAPETDTPEMPPWFNAEIHRVEPRGIVMAASGDLLAEDGLPVNAAARAALANETAPAEAPATSTDLNAEETNNASTRQRVEGQE
jgi:hypothetical protein